MISQYQSKTFASSLAVTGTNVYTLEALPLETASGYSITVRLTGTATGSVLLEGTCDGTTWATLGYLDNSGTISLDAATADDRYIWNVPSAFYKAVRVVYTNATNSGTLSASFFAKG
jgi:hypothetical protein